MLVGLGDDATDADAVRRAAGVAARAVTNAASVALALPADTPELVARGHRGHAARRLHVHDVQERRPKTARRARRGRRAQRRRAAARTSIARLRARRRSSPTPSPPPATGSTPRRATCTPPAVRRRRRRGGQGAHQGPRRAQGQDRCSTRGARRAGYGGILGVGAGLGRAAAAGRADLRARRTPSAHLALVGKGITFDSGGLSIKPAAGMTTMKSDMAGAAAVVAGDVRDRRSSACRSRSPTFAPMAENMLSGTANRPGDVLTMYGGKTVEVLNTDAEGRLVLADALVRATEEKPDVILDVATLTGAHGRRARRQGRRRDGHRRRSSTGVLAAADGRRRGSTWPMPIPEEMDERIHSQQDRRPRPARLDPLGRRPVRRRRSCASSPAGCRGRTSTSPARRSTRRRLRPRHHGRHRRRGRAPWSTSPAWPPTAAGAQADVAAAPARAPCCFLRAVVVAHPLREADHRGVVRRDLVLVAEVVRPLRPTAPGAGSTRRRGRPAAGSRR